MIESKTPLSEEPIDMLEQVDLVDILKARIPEENAPILESSQLIEMTDTALHKEISDRGKFTREDLEKLLRNEERLQAAVEFLVQENSRLITVNNSKEEKILASIDMIVSQRDWVHSLLDDNVSLRAEVDRHVKEKLDFDADMAYQISALKNSKEELEEEVASLKAETQQLESQVIDFDEQVKKSASVLKKSQVHKNALSEKLELMESNQVKYKWYMGILGAAAFVFFSIAVVSYINSITSNRVSSTDLLSGTTTTEATDSITSLVDSNSSAKQIAVDVPIEIAPDGFINSSGSEVIVENNTEVLDDKKVDEILKQPINNNLIPLPENKTTIVKKDTVSNKPTKSDLASTPKKAKKPNQTYVVKANDSLYQISKKFYGSSDYVEKIKKENKIGKNLVVGKKLIISSLDEE